jgi:hypothetical protein
LEKEEELEVEDLLVVTDRKDTLKYDVRFAKHIMVSAIPLVMYTVCILTNTQCST